MINKTNLTNVTPPTTVASTSGVPQAEASSEVTDTNLPQRSSHSTRPRSASIGSTSTASIRSAGDAWSSHSGDTAVLRPEVFDRADLQQLAPAATVAMNQILNHRAAQGVDMSGSQMVGTLRDALQCDAATTDATVLRKFIGTIPHMATSPTLKGDDQIKAINTVWKVVPNLSMSASQTETLEIAKAACDIVPLVGTDRHTRSFRSKLREAAEKSFAGNSLDDPTLWLSTLGAWPVAEATVRSLTMGVRVAKYTARPGRTVNKALDLVAALVRGVPPEHGLGTPLANAITGILSTHAPADSKHLAKLKKAFMEKATPQEAAEATAALSHPPVAP